MGVENKENNSQSEVLLSPREKAISFIEKRYEQAKSTRWDTYVSYENTIEFFSEAEGAAELAVELGLITTQEAGEIKKRYKSS